MLWFFSQYFRFNSELKTNIALIFLFLLSFPFFSLFKTVSVLKVLSQGFLACFLFSSTLGENSWIKETLRKSIPNTSLYPFHEITPRELCMTYHCYYLFGFLYRFDILLKLFFYSLRSCTACMRTHIERERREKINDETEWKKSWRNKDKKKQRKHKMDFSWNWKIDSPSEVLMVLRRKKFMVYVYGISLHLVLNTNYGLRHEMKSSI